MKIIIICNYFEDHAKFAVIKLHAQLYLQIIDEKIIIAILFCRRKIYLHYTL